MPSGRLSLYRFIEDAWSGGLRAWCEDARQFDGESWLVVENSGMSRWLSPRFVAEGVSKIHVFDAAGLREELAKMAGAELPRRRQALQAFVAKVAAAQEENESAQSAVRNARALAEACDVLTRSGWHLNQLGLEAGLARRINRAMDRTPIFPGVFERRLREALSPQPIRLCIVGWDATHWPDLGLLHLAADKVRSRDFFVPLPRLPADALQREWIDALEQSFDLERTACPASDYVSQNEPLVSRLDKSQLDRLSEPRAPVLLVGREWSDQVRLVCEQVTTWLSDPALSGPIGVAAPEDSPTAIAVAAALQNLGIAVEHPVRSREPDAPLLLLEQIAQYHLSDHGVDELIELARMLWLYRREDWAALEPESVWKSVNQAFKTAQSRNARILAQSQPRRKDTAWAAVCKIISALGRWEEDLPWPALRAKWENLLTSLRLSPDALGTVWEITRDLFRDERIPGRAFMEWIAEELSEHRQEVPAPNYGLPARVVVTSFAGAAQQTWERLIFLDSNEHVWPAPVVENPFLPDSVRCRLNINRKETAHLLTSQDFRILEQSRFLDLIEHCRGPFAFAGVLLEQTEAGDHAQPNDWVIRTLLESAGENETSPLDRWAASAKAFPPADALPLNPAEHAHLSAVHASRQDRSIPFDSYFLNFSGSKLEPDAWSATDLDLAITRPATFALMELFGAEAIVGSTFARAEGAVVGNLTHRWLARILGLPDSLSLVTSTPDPEPALRREIAAFRQELEEWYAAEDLPMPIWWETCLRKTAWATRRCLREVRGLIQGQYCAAEQRLAVTVKTPAGPLMLKGRIDLLISDRPEIGGATVRIYDFKTGRDAAPTTASLHTGRGAQFAAYYLMARDSGAAYASIGIIKPDAQAQEVFSNADEVALRAHFGVFADLASTLRFGRLGPLVSEYAPCESLPLATTPVDPEVLKQKAELFLIAG